MSDNNSNSEWIYLLLTLLFSAIAYVKSLVNKKNTPKPPLPEAFPPFPNENLNENTSFSVEDEVEDYTVAKEYSFSNSYFSEKDKEELPLQEKTEDTIEEDPFFDLKKAVIYTEILNRKYD